MKIGAGLAARKHKTCSHVSTIIINSAGLEREICESCGHVSFAFEDEESETTVGRHQFARPIDDSEASFR